MQDKVSAFFRNAVITLYSVRHPRKSRGDLISQEEVRQCPYTTMLKVAGSSETSANIYEPTLRHVAKQRSPLSQS
jgi:hypothetical protein